MLLSLNKSILPFIKFVFKSIFADSNDFSFLLEINKFLVIKTPFLIIILPKISEGVSANVSKI